MYPQAVPRRPWRNSSGTCRWFPDAMVAASPWASDKSLLRPKARRPRPRNEVVFRRKNRVKQRRLDRPLCLCWDWA